MRRVPFVVLAIVVAGRASAPAPVPVPAQESHPLAPGGGIASVTEGSGPPLIIIHGGWGDQRSCAASAKVLSASSTVIRASLRLHWPNPWPAIDDEAYATYTVATHAADVAALIQASGVGRRSTSSATPTVDWSRRSSHGAGRISCGS